MSGVAGPSEPDARADLEKLRFALAKLDVVRPTELRIPLAHLLRAAIESIERYGSTLGLNVVHELELADVILAAAAARNPPVTRVTMPTSDGHLSFTADPTWPDVWFHGGPWAGAHVAVRTITAPVFASGSEVGRHYWLDARSDPPTYHWRPEANVVMTGRDA
jgi:hypothetical protein